MNDNIETPKLRVYLDTSVISALFDERNPERQQLTEKFFEKSDSFIIFIFEIVLAEIDDIKSEDIKQKYREEALKYQILEINEGTQRLAREYIKFGTIPEKYSEDSIHIAVATLNSMDYLLSWNFRHIVKIKTREIINKVNSSLGHPELKIITPAEVL